MYGQCDIIPPFLSVEDGRAAKADYLLLSVSRDQGAGGFLE